MGIDIYKYSKKSEKKQILIPLLFRMIFKEVCRWIKTYEKFMFEKYLDKNIFDFFIDTGDGGFIIFDNPLLAISFAINFSALLHAFNSYHFYPKLRKIIGKIELRYSITFDKIYKINKNYYGSGIINNARILSKDSLNRCLIDKNTYDWFLINTNGIEIIKLLSLTDIKKLECFKNIKYRELSKKIYIYKWK